MHIGVKKGSMERFDDIRARIEPPNEAARSAAHLKWNAIAKPIGSLGALESMVEQMAALSGTPDVRIDKRAVVVLCADNGVVAQGVSQSGSEITTLIAGSIAKGRSSVCRMAQTAHADAFAVDMGMLSPSTEPEVIDRCIARGTADISCGPAMSRSQAVKAVLEGVQLVGEFKERGYRILATGEMGIGNTTTSSAMTAAFFGLPANQVAGRGAGLSDAGLQRKQAAIERALQANAPNRDNPLDVLAKLGGFDIAGLAGMFIGGAVHRIPIVIDGFISALAAYTAWRIAPECRCAMLPSHLSSEPATHLLFEALELHPVIQAGMHLGEGTGAVCLIPLLDAALALYNGTTFEQTGMNAYEVNPQ